MKKVKLLYLLLFILFTQYSFAQWPIPDAQQQPQWHMAFWFKDANGEMDTVYIGYDSTAHKAALFEEDVKFHEYRKIDTSKFQAILWPGYNNTKDSAWKVEIRGGENITTSIGFINGKMPLTMYWSDSLFNSPDLPDKYFPDKSPRPRARGDLKCGGEGCGYMGHYGYILLTNNNEPINSFPYAWSKHQDSIVFEGTGIISDNNGLRIHSLAIVPIDLVIQSINENNNFNKFEFNIYPNPVKNTLQIEHNYTSPIHIQFSNLQGKVLHTNTYTNQTINIDMSAYPSGMYFLQLIDEAGNSSVRQIIVE